MVAGSSPSAPSLRQKCAFGGDQHVAHGGQAHAAGVAVALDAPQRIHGTRGLEVLAGVDADGREPFRGLRPDVLQVRDVHFGRGQPPGLAFLVDHRLARALVCYMRNTPNRVGSIGALSAAESPSASTVRVSAGSMIPSSHSRALA
jgi:hypothetical protein